MCGGISSVMGPHSIESDQNTKVSYIDASKTIYMHELCVNIILLAILKIVF